MFGLLATKCVNGGNYTDSASAVSINTIQPDAIYYAIVKQVGIKTYENQSFRQISA